MDTSTPLPNSLRAFLESGNYNRIPIKRQPTGHLTFPAELNGVAGLFAIDTGAGGTFVDEQLADKYSLTLIESDVTGAGAGGSQLKVMYAENTTFKAGNFKKENFKISTLDLDHVNQGLAELGSEKVDGFIGADILFANTAVIDYSELAIYLVND